MTVVGEVDKPYPVTGEVSGYGGYPRWLLPFGHPLRLD